VTIVDNPKTSIFFKKKKNQALKGASQKMEEEQGELNHEGAEMQADAAKKVHLALKWALQFGPEVVATLKEFRKNFYLREFHGENFRRCGIATVTSFGGYCMYF
jgi:hypothetical protein